MKDIPFITDIDLLVISIPISKKKIVNTFYDEKLKKQQSKYFHIYNIKHPAISDDICLPLKNVENLEGYSTEAIFPESVTRAIVGMLIGK